MKAAVMARGRRAGRAVPAGRRPALGLTALLLLAALATHCSHPPAGPGRVRQAGGRRSPPVALARPLRVGIREAAESVRVATVTLGDVPGAARTAGPNGAPPAILLGPDGGILGRFASLVIEPRADGLAVRPARGAGRVLADTLRLEAPPGAVLRIDGTAYRGGLEVFGHTAGGLSLVNLVDLEDYLLGVVPLEIGSRGPEVIEAVKAQSIAARTYALSHLGRWPEQGFDLYGDVRDQVYGGLDAERPGVSAAVRATAGVVAVYDGLLIGAYYSACCGGRLAPAHETWDVPPAPYLRTRRDRRHGADFCSGYKDYRWEHRWSAGEFMALMEEHYVEEFGGDARPSGPLEGVTVDSRFRSGRVRRMTVRAGGRRYRMGGDRVRWVLRRGGGAILRSSLFEIEVKRRGNRVEAVVARGAGYGHGVGVCQAGALEMARQGYRADEILRHYYPGVELVPLWSP